MTREIEFTVLCPFGGSGGGALGFIEAEKRLFETNVRFRCLGSIDFDETACDDFERFVGSPAYRIDVEWLSAAQLRAVYGTRAPDVVFMSPPCKGSSRLLSAKKAATAKYERMNRLALVWTRVMLEAWSDPPALVLLENVPGLPQRAQKMVRELRRTLRAAGYVFHDGFHDCGEIGGLAQHRKRYLLVARHPKKCAPLLYKPPARRVRGCGEVLGELPMPATTAAGAWGALHELPKLCWRNWLRLALIPAGGDWRDLEGVLAEEQARREKFARHRVEDWAGPTGAVRGSGSNGVENVADPRIELHCAPHPGAYGVTGWDETSKTIAGSSKIDNRPVSIADPRVAQLELEERAGRHWNKYAVGGWEDPAKTVIGKVQIGSGRPAVADPRVRDWNPNAYGVASFEQPAGTVTGNPSTSGGRRAVADPRALACAPRDGNWSTYGVTPFAEPAGTVAGESSASNGRYSVADPRIEDVRVAPAHHGAYGVRPWEASAAVVTGAADGPSSGRFAVADPRVERAFDAGYGVLDWADPARTIAATPAVGCGAYSVADPRPQLVPSARVMTLDEALDLDLDPAKPPPFIPLIVARDGTWHRPLTLLELAALQGYPMRMHGRPLRFGGTRTIVAEHIGNSVPPPAARAIADQMLIALAQHEFEAFALSCGDVWVSPEAKLRRAEARTT